MCCHGTEGCKGKGDKHFCRIPITNFSILSPGNEQAVRCMHLLLTVHCDVGSVRIEHDGHYSKTELEFRSTHRLSHGDVPHLASKGSDGLGGLFKVLAMHVARESGLPSSASDCEMYEWAASLLMNEANKVRR